LKGKQTREGEKEGKELATDVVAFSFEKKEE